MACALLAMQAVACRHQQPKVEVSPLERAAKEAGLTLPQAPYAWNLGDKPQVIVVVTRDRVSVAGDRFPIANVPADGRLGLSAADKLDGFRDEYFVTPLAHAIVGAPRPVVVADAGDEAPTEVAEAGISRSPSVVVVADAKTPYRVLAEVVATAANAKKDHVGLAAQGKDGITVMPLAYLHAPAGFENVISGGSPYRRMALEPRPLIVIRHDGFAVRFGSTPVGAGCKGPGTGLTVPNDAAGARAFTDLRDCLERMRNAAPDSADIAWLGAEPDVDVGTLVATRDAIAQDAKKGGLIADIGLLKPVDREVVQ
jgi:hypothetical protein